MGRAGGGCVRRSPEKRNNPDTQASHRPRYIRSKCRKRENRKPLARRSSLTRDTPAYIFLIDSGPVPLRELACVPVARYQLKQTALPLSKEKRINREPYGSCW